MKKRGYMSKKFLFSSAIITLTLICFMWFVFAASPNASLNSPSDGHVFYGSTTSVVLNVTVTDAEGDNTNVSFYNGICFIWDLSYYPYDSISILTQNGAPQDLFFSSDGTRLYEIGYEPYGSNSIYQYTCSDAWNLSSCSYDSISILTQDNDPKGLFFNPDGSRLYEIGDSSNKIYQYSCSDAWNISSCSYDSIYISTQDNYPQSLFFKPDGLGLYEIGRGKDEIYQYTCSDAWNISSCSYVGVNILTQDGNPSDLFFKPDGLRLYEIGYSGDNIYQYTCSDAWNLSSCSYDSIYISTQDNDPKGLFFKPDGLRLYEIGEGGAKIYQYSLNLDLLKTSTDVANGSDVTYVWSNLSSGTYNWYVEVTDGINTTQSSEWNFSINYPPTTPTSLILNNVNVSDTLTANCLGSTDADDDTIIYHYEFYNVNDSITLQAWGTDNTYVIQLSDSHDMINVTCGAYDSINYSAYNISDTTIVNNSMPSSALNSPSNSEIFSPNITSVILNITVTDVDNDTMNVTFYNSSDNSVICANTSISNSSEVICNWTGLSEGAYQWYVNITDGIDTSQSSEWNFSIQNIAPSIDLNSPSDMEIFPINTSYVILNVTLTDADGDNMNVTFYNASDDSILCANTSISNSSEVICNWTGLSDGIHQWYVDVTDGINTTQSSTWNFIILSSLCGSNITSDYTMSSSIYCNTTAIYLDNDVTFDCDDNSIVFVGLDNTGYYAFNVSLVDNITIQNCNMEGFGIFADNATNLDILDNEIFNVSAVNTNAITIEYGENITIERNLFNGTNVAMIEGSHQYKHWKAIMVNTDSPVANSTINLVIYNNTIFDHEWAMEIGGVTNANVSRNKLNLTKLYRGMTISFRYVINGVFDRNVQYRTIDDVWYMDSDGYVVDTGCRNITISNGNITNINVHGIIMLDMLQTDDYPQNITIENMTIRNCVYSSGKGISFYGGASDRGVYTENSSVIGNNISLCAYGIEVGAGYGGASNSRFINNTIYDISPYWGIYDHDWGPVRANNLFENNVIYNMFHLAFSFTGSINSSFINNTVYNGGGMGFQGEGYNNIFINNTVYNTTSSAIGYVSENATFTGNLIYDTNGIGIQINSNCNLTGNTIRNVTRGIYINGDNNNVSSNILENNDYSIYLSDSDNNSFYDMDASDSVLMDIYSNSSSSTDNYFTNVSHDKSDVFVYNSANISFKWYLDAHATDIGGQDLANVTIIGWDTNSNQQFSNITDEEGDIQRQIVDEYYQTQSGRTYFTDYIIRASKSGYDTKSKTEEITTNVFLDFSWLIEEEGGGNRGGSGACTTQWNCSEWGECVDNIQTRICSYPENWCEPREDKPVEFQTCVLDIDEKEENNIIEEKINEWNFAWLIVLLILVIAIVITKKIKETKDLRKSPQLKKEHSLVGWKI